MKTEKSFVCAMLSLFSVFWASALIMIGSVILPFSEVAGHLAIKCLHFIVIGFDAFAIIKCSKSGVPKNYKTMAIIGLAVFAVVMTPLIYTM